MEVFLIFILVLMVGGIGFKILTANNSDEEEYEYTSSLVPEGQMRIKDVGAQAVSTFKPSYGETTEAFEARLLNAFAETYKFEDEEAFNEDNYNEEWFMAGVSHHASTPFVTFGYATRDRNNKYSSRAVAVIDYKNRLLGYIPEKSLEHWYDVTEGEDTPVIAFAYIQGGKLFGSIYTYDETKSDYQRMLKQYMKLLKMHN